MGESAGPIERPTSQLEKESKGITGVDEVSGGGLSLALGSVVNGTAGSGTTIFGLKFLVKGALNDGETGVLMDFEESSPNLRQDVSSLGFNLKELVNNKQLTMESCRINGSEIVTIDCFDLGRLFVHLDHASNPVGAQRVVVDPIETLLSFDRDRANVGVELLHLCDWLNERSLGSVKLSEGAYSEQTPDPGRPRPDRTPRGGAH
jgi:circadian clock protein KaiC